MSPKGAFAFEGRYVAGDKSYRQELTIRKRADGRFNVTAVVGTEGCSGIIENAVGAADGDTLKAKGEEDDETVRSHNPPHEERREPRGRRSLH
jgi:hypothetical protein